MSAGNKTCLRCGGPLGEGAELARSRDGRAIGVDIAICSLCDLDEYGGGTGGRALESWPTHLAAQQEAAIIERLRQEKTKKAEATTRTIEQAQRHARRWFASASYEQLRWFESEGDKEGRAWGEGIKRAQSDLYGAEVECEREGYWDAFAHAVLVMWANIRDRV